MQIHSFALCIILLKLQSCTLVIQQGQFLKLDAVTWQSNIGMSTYKACHKPCILLKSHIPQMFHGWSYKPRCPPGGTHALGKERM